MRGSSASRCRPMPRCWNGSASPPPAAGASAAIPGHAPAPGAGAGAAGRAASVAAGRTHHRPGPGLAPAVLPHRRRAARGRRHHPAQHARPVRAGRTRRPRRGHEGRTQDRRRHPVRTAPAHRPAAAHPPDAGRAWVRVWVCLAPARAAAPPWRALDSGRYERLCAEDEKVAAIRAIGAIGQDIRDLDIDVPGLDEIYAHLLEREDI